MSNRQFESNSGGAGLDLSAVVLRDAYEQPELASLHADRALAFASINHSIGSLKIKPGEARYYEYPLSISERRKIVIARLQGKYGEEIRVFLNDEMPHPVSSLIDVRRMRMATLVASNIGKRVASIDATMDRDASVDGKWCSDGNFVGPYIWHEMPLDLVEVRGAQSNLLLELPIPGYEKSGIESAERTITAVYLASLLSTVPAIHQVEGVSVIMPTAAKFASS